MSELRGNDLRKALELVRSISEAGGTAELRRRVPAELRRLIGADHASYDDLDLAASALIQIDDPEDFVVPNFDWVAANVTNRHPLLNVIRGGGADVVQTSDVLSRRAWHRHPLYTRCFRPTGREHQILAGLGGPEPLFGAFALSRNRRGFTERERELLSLVRPHVIQARANAELRDVLAARGAVEGSAGVVVLAASVRIAAMDERASAIMAAQFGADTSPGGRLPDPLDAWAREQLARLDPGGEAPRPLRAWNGHHGGRRLVVRLLPPETEADSARIVLDEDGEPEELSVEGMIAIGLTRREGEVLRLADRGLITEAIGSELEISPRTVQKHLERVHEKLGVGTRAAAIARARDAIAPRG